MSPKPDYSFQESLSIRGRLDPPATSPHRGWRFLQCTDKFDELKVSQYSSLTNVR